MNEEKKEGFSYQSPQKQIKSAAFLFAIEFIALGVAIVIIILGLFYLNILKVDMITSFFGASKLAVEQKKYPQNQNGERPLSGYIKEGKGSENSVVTVLNSNKDYTLILKDSDAIIKLLKDWKLFGASLYDNNEEIESTKPFSKLVINLVGSRQSTDIIQGITSYSTNVSQNTINFNIYVNPQILENSKLDAKTKGDYVLYSLIFVTYRMSHQRENTKVQIKSIDEIFKTISKKGILEISSR